MFKTLTLPAHTQLETAQCDLCGLSNLQTWDVARGNTLSRCLNCGLIFVNPRITDKSKKERLIYSDEYFERADRMTQKMITARQKSYRQEIEKLESLTPGAISGGKILDVGCGTGVFLKAFNDIRWETYGCDVSTYAVAEARKTCSHIYQGEFEELKFENLFNVIYFRASLHHAYSPRQCLLAAANYLADDGILAITMSNNCGGICGRLFRGHVKSYEQSANYLFSTDVLKKYLDRCGFETLHVSYPYFGTGYGSWLDFVQLPLSYMKLLWLSASRQLNTPTTCDFASPTFYGNYVNIYGRKR